MKVSYRPCSQYSAIIVNEIKVTACGRFAHDSETRNRIYQNARALNQLIGVTKVDGKYS